MRLSNRRLILLSSGIALGMGLLPATGWAAPQPQDVQRGPMGSTSKRLPASSLAQPASSVTSPETLKLAVKPASRVIKNGTLEPVEVDTRMPVIPLAAARPVETDNMNLAEAKEALQQLIRAQEKMMSQMQVLQARIEKTEQVTQNNQKAITASSEQLSNDASVLQSLSRRVTLMGYVESGYRAYSNAPRDEEFLGANGRSGNDFSARRVVLRPRMNFNDRASWYGELEVEDVKHEVSMEESVFNYAYRPWLNFKTGVMTLPYTTTVMNHDAPLRLLVDRPLVDTLVIPSTYSDLGVGVTGLLPVGRRSALNYEFDVVNGFTDAFAAAGAGQRVSSSVEYQGIRDLRPGEHVISDQGRDNNSNKQLFGRVGFSPFPGLQMAVSGSTGKIDSNNRVGMTMLAGELMYRVKKWSFLGEYATAMLNNKANGLSSQGVPYKLFPGSLDGYFVQAAYDIAPKWTAITAFNYVNLDKGSSGNSQERISLGMRYNPFNNVYLKTEYQFNTPRSQFNSAQERYSNAILTQLTFSLQ